MEKKWWHNQAIYQIYTRSFYDSNGDGIGDLNGIIKKLDYLKTLGVTIIWLCPIYQSPNDDNGYDISCYYSIMDDFGTIDDFDRLITESRTRGIRIILDLVLNHTSDEHPWFVNAKCSKDNPYRDYYIWRDPVAGQAPNGLEASFGGSAWEYNQNTNQYYFHSFSKKQPDLNWKNEELRHKLYEMINFWVRKGVSGFRLDAIDSISKDVDRKITHAGPEIHDYLREMYLNTFGKNKDLFTVGETAVADPKTAKRYTDPNHEELDMIFQFELMGIDGVRSGNWDPKKFTLIDLKKVMSKWQEALNEISWNSLFWDNHDFPRVVSRFGNDSEKWRTISAKMLATLLHGMKGIPYIYQGEELGMTNIQLNSINDYRDIESKNFYKQKSEEGWTNEEIMNSIYRNSRDNARTPMQWNNTENGGFTKGEPWIKVNPNYTSINAEDSMKDPNSIFYYYQKLLSLRSENEVLVYGDYHLLRPDHHQVFAYSRTFGNHKVLVVCNFYDKDTEINLQVTGEKTPKILISNYKDTSKALNDLKLRPYEAVIYRID